MTNQEAIREVADLAEKIYPTHPEASAVLFTLAGSLGGGAEYVTELMDVATRVARSQIERMERGLRGGGSLN